MIKVCGMTDGDNIRQVEALGVDLLGFIFYPKSPRYVQHKPSYLPVHAKRVGVFVDASETQLSTCALEYALHYLQLHGQESPQACQRLRQQGYKVIKAFSIATAADLQRVALYESCCDLYLFDTKTPGYGGSGHSFDWTLLQAYSGSTPFLLSGGIGLQSLPALQLFSHPMMAGYDLNSRFETSPGIKDINLLSNFLKHCI